MWQNLKQLIKYSKDGILSKSLTKDEKVDSTLFCLAAGTSLSEHTSTKEGLIYVIEGRGIFNLQGEEIKMKPGLLIKMSRNVAHSLKVEVNTSFLLLLFS